MSLNIKGLGKPSKKLALGRLVDLHKPKGQKSDSRNNGKGRKDCEDLSKTWKEWNFLAIDSTKRYEALLTGWRKISMRLISSMILASRIGVELY
jgi:hypothetical protein